VEHVQSTDVGDRDVQGFAPDPTRMTLEWVAHAMRPNVRAFVTSDFAPRLPLDEPQLDELANLVIDSIADRAVVQRMAELLGDDAALARLAAGRTSVVRGDFGEVFAAACVEILEGWRVPVRKLRFKIDPEQTQPGTDIVAIRMNGDEVDALEFIESKLRTGAGLHVAVEAHEQLRADLEKGFGDILEFTAERLAESQPATYEALLRYLERRDLDEESPDQFGIVLVWDRRMWDERVLDNLEDADPLVQPLHVRAAQFEELAYLVASVYARVGLEVLDDGS
jgi:hypothetical protein